MFDQKSWSKNCWLKIVDFKEDLFGPKKCWSQKFLLGNCFDLKMFVSTFFFRSKRTSLGQVLPGQMFPGQVSLGVQGKSYNVTLYDSFFGRRP